MLFVLKKDKIVAFAVACSTVFVLFLISTLFAKTPENTVQTSTSNIQNIELENEIELNNIENNNEKS